MNLENIYNENYGSVVVTNGDFVAVGNPPYKPYDVCEGFGRLGQVFLIKKNDYEYNYTLSKIFKKVLTSENGYVTTYYTEQSSSAALTASLVAESGSYGDSYPSCSYIVAEDGTQRVFQSNYGSSLDLSKFFLAIGDTGTTSSIYVGNTSSFASVDIYVVNPNYTYNVNSGLTELFGSSVVNLSEYNINDIPICTITGSIDDEFGYSVSLTNNYLAVSAPNYNNGRGAVYIYKYIGSNCIYELNSIISASIIDYPKQYRFGHSICLDKKNENKLLVGSSQISQSNVYLYFLTSSKWTLEQTFSENTSSIYHKLDDSAFILNATGSQTCSRYGYSVSLYDNILAVGAPNDLVYTEYVQSPKFRQRGSVYVYGYTVCDDNKFQEYNLLTKLYGDKNTFKDNLFGYSVCVNENKILVGSPKPYFPFSSLFISNSIDFYDKTFDQNDNGQSTYCGQSLLYKVTGSNIFQLTTQPIGKRKEYGQPFTAFGYSVSLSEENLVIGAPIPLNDDFRLSGLFITETGSANPSSIGYYSNYIYTSSYQSEDCIMSSKFVYFETEECVTCDGTPTSGALSGACSNPIVFVDEQGEYFEAGEKIFGKAYIYNISDLEKDYHVGNIFYNNNKIIINNTGSILNKLTLDPVDTTQPYLYMEYKSQLGLFEKQYICTVDPGEFNISTNPSATTSSYFDYGVLNQNGFNFDNLDIILRYINYRSTNNGSEKWWNNIVSGEVEQSIFSYYTSSYNNYNTNRLNQSLKNKCSNVDFDVNGDGIANIQDATLIWKYFIYQLTPENFKDCINPRAKRTVYDDVLSFLIKKTGTFNTRDIKSEFFHYNYSSSLDPTGSYLAPYITTVGLYSGGDLVAIAKLAQPIKNTGEIPINIVVKWDV